VMQRIGAPAGLERGRDYLSPATGTATVNFSLQREKDEARPIIFKLMYNVYFISAQVCRRPHGHAGPAPDDLMPHLTHKHGEVLPSHPLHETYKYKIKALWDLPESTPPNHTVTSEPVWIIDARGGRNNDVFARSWCAYVGSHAIIARVGKTCLSCVVREAKALEVGIVIRV